MEQRKKDHIELALRSQSDPSGRDTRFSYEPVLSAHPASEWGDFTFLGKKMKAPIWISSMTGGTEKAFAINRNLAEAVAEFGLGMGLGSCRIILDDDSFFRDFDLRNIIGDEYPFFANLGIAQVEELLSKGEEGKIERLVERLKADGLIVHVNPLQEWLQPEGDRLVMPPLVTITDLIGKLSVPIIVKEVGQGMGPESLKALLGLPLAAVEFAAFGGTNFASLELLRSEGEIGEMYSGLAAIGHSAAEMTQWANEIVDENPSAVKCREIIVSGGIKSFLDGFYYINKLRLTSIYGQASAFLKYAEESAESLKRYIKYQVEGLKLAKNYLKVK